jgi:hypothetical protein
MTLSELKQKLTKIDRIRFSLPDGKSLPEHFHITEVGLLTRKFIDCGGKLRENNSVNLQLWVADDLDHRLSPEKLIQIIEKSENLIPLDDYEIEIEYQMDTISKFGMEFSNNEFILTRKQTECLAQDQCGIPETKPKFNLKERTPSSLQCTPGGKCC